jgi:hypothetical protein
MPEWWYIPVIPVLTQLKQKDHELEVSLQLYTARLSQNKNIVC